MEQNLNEIIKTSEVIIHEGRYAYLKAKEKPKGEHFMISQDKDEITVITEEKRISEIENDDSVKWFKLIEIKVSAPFIAKGFLAKVTKTIADKDLNVLMVSTFSKDYALVREETSKIAINALKEAGFPVKVTK